MKRFSFLSAVSAAFCIFITVSFNSFLLGVLFVPISVLLCRFFYKTSFSVLTVVALICVFCCFNAHIINTRVTVTELNKSGAVELTAQLISHESFSDNTLKATFRLITVNTVKVRNEKVFVYLKNVTNPHAFVPGGIYRFTDIYVIDTSPKNPGQFNFGRYLKSIGLSGAISAVSENVSFINRESLPFFFDRLMEARNSIAASLDSMLEDAEIVKGILFGIERSDSETAEIFRMGGSSHILAVSGLHVGIMYGFINFVLSLFKLKPKIKIPLCLMFVMVYVSMSGFSVSALRALIMLYVLAFTGSLNKKPDAFNALCISAVIIMLINPLCIYTASFLLSFGATAGIILFYAALSKKIEAIRRPAVRTLAKYLCVCVSAQLLSVPTALALFGRINPLSLFVNLLCVPLVGAVFVSGIILVVFNVLGLPSGLFVCAINLISAYFKAVNSFFSSPSFSNLYFKADFATVALCLIVLLTLFGYICVNKRLKPAVLAVCFALSVFASSIKKTPEVAFLSVGLGDCAVITDEEGKSYMIDCGECLGENTAENIILPYLNYKGITRLEAVFISHTDSDHCGALDNIINKVEIGRIYINNDKTSAYHYLQKLAAKNGIATHAAFEGDIISFGSSACFTVLWPDRNADFIDKNADSSALYISIRGTGFLFLGDLEYNGIKHIIEAYTIKAEVIKAAHHGSYSPESLELYEEAGLKTLVVSVGENDFGLPNSALTLLAELLPAEVLDTSRSGAIIISLSNNGAAAKCFIK